MLKNLFRSIYLGLPVIREFRALHQELKKMHRVSLLQLATQSDSSESIILAGTRYQNPKNLNQHARQVFSQSGEDGMILEIFQRIGVESKTFLEIGVGDGLENNTAFLLWQGWSGYWVDGNPSAMKFIRRHFCKPIAESRLRTTHSFVTAENINDIVRTLGIPQEIDLLSLDIDRNTYWVWAALTAVRPRAVVVEYNAALPPTVDWKVDYVPDRQWNGSMYYGASLKSLELLGREMGYCLVGCTLNGVNAFFVRQDLCANKFEEPFTAEHHYEPQRPFLTRREGHPACFSDEANS